MPFFYFDWTFIIIIPTLIFAIVAQIKVKSNFTKYSRTNTSGMTGAQAAEKVLRLNGINDVRVEQTQGRLSDHFDPRAKVIRLSPEVYGGATIAAVGIACHEAGHACQYHESYLPMKLRSAIIPVTNIGSMLGIPLAFIGFFMNVGILVSIGLILYATVAAFQLVTLPVEFNASSRALRTIEENHMLNDEEYRGAKKMLTSAALTYVAALLSSLAQLLRLALIFRRND